MLYWSRSFFYEIKSVVENLTYDKTLFDDQLIKLIDWSNAGWWNINKCLNGLPLYINKMFATMAFLTCYVTRAASVSIFSNQTTL